jgi:hypothetical protein
MADRLNRLLQSKERLLLDVSHRRCCQGGPIPGYPQTSSRLP